MITKFEVKRLFSLMFIFTGIGVLSNEVRDYLLSVNGFNPFIVGLVIIFVGAWLFDVR